MTRAFIGIGSNLDDPHRHVGEAIAELSGMPDTRLVAQSSLYRTAPLGFSSQPDFVNAVVAVETALQPEPLLDAMQAIERQHARVRSFANAPRTLDLDLLLFGGESIHLPRLTVPHPRMHQRAFVLAPLLEIAPQAEIPGLGAVRDLLPDCAGQRAERIA